MKYSSLRLKTALSPNLLGIYFYYCQGNTQESKKSLLFTLILLFITYFFIIIKLITFKTKLNSAFKLAGENRKELQ